MRNATQRNATQRIATRLTPSDPTLAAAAFVWSLTMIACGMCLALRSSLN